MTARSSFPPQSAKRRKGDSRTTTQRGYGASHQAVRRRWEARVAGGGVRCARCGGFIVPGEPWDLGHDDSDRSLYAGAEHRRCNRATSAHRVQREVAPKFSRKW
jgi:hypothetical protein